MLLLFRHHAWLVVFFCVGLAWLCDFGMVCWKPQVLDAFQKLGMEPEVLALSAYETYEVKLALSMEETVKMLRQAK